MKIFYRISDGGYNKIKPDYITNQNCLYNFLSISKEHHTDIFILADGVSDDTFLWLEKICNMNEIKSLKRSQLGSGAQSFREVLKEALNLDSPNNEIVYFLEDDYIHKPKSLDILKEGFEIGADYVTLYDHPDKYIDGDKGGNPEVKNGGEITRVFLGPTTHFKLTNSTTMTFATTLGTLKEDKDVFYKYTQGTYPQDYDIFIRLREKERSLIVPIPGVATHGETNWLCPLTNWKEICKFTVDDYILL